MKYLLSKIDQIRLFKYNFERIVLFQISLGLVLSILFFASDSYVVLILTLIIGFPLTLKKKYFYISVIVGLLFFISWKNSINFEVKNVVGQSGMYSAEVVSLERGELQNQITLKINNLNGEAISKVGAYSNINLYDKVSLDGKLELPKSFDDFDYPAYLKSQKIFYEFKGIISLEKKENNILTFFRDLKDKLINISNKNLSSPLNGLFNGILLGDTSLIDNTLKDNFRLTGTSHILSVSGFNFTIILIFLLSFSFLIGRKKALILSSVFIIGFLLLVGLNNVTALRATLMILIYIFANLLGRKLNYLYLVSFTLAVFLIDYPLSYTNLSLQLSFGSLLGLFFLAKPFTSFFKNLPEILSETLSATFAAILGTLPFTLITFGTLSLVAPIVNIIILPLIPFVMLLGFIAEAFGILNLNEISKILFMICELVLKFVTEVVNKFASLPFANTSNNVVIFIFVIILISIFIFADYRNFYKKYY